MSEPGRDSAARSAASPTPVGGMIRGGLVAGTVAGVLTAVVSVLVWGMASVWSALTATAVTMGFFLLGVVGVKAVVGGDPSLSLPGAFVVYLGQLILLAFVLLTLARLEWVHGRAFAVAAILQALAWQVGLVTGFVRSRILVAGDGRR